ncbi:ABC transporter permease [Rhodococcus sp. X156]|uniref:ABC transporter permease n=1 Tax=Rhodococcus sp. X156 TaxID=2499145 RepID=UPI000FD6E986|nr:ABC transporter permease [Rhodococcus sp. X156]
MTAQADARGQAEPRFPAGTFAPDPRPATPGRMLLAQGRLELLLLLRNGEQLLLTMLIPITLLVGLSLLPIVDLPEPRVDSVVPGVMALAVMSTAFTGQAIAVGFDRRYGALKRLGATPLPRWGILGGKVAAVLVVVALQALLLGVIGLAIGWRPSVAGLALGVIALAVGTFAFGALGLLIGGWLKAEIVLALANIIWFVLLGLGGIVVPLDRLPDALAEIARLLPSGALTEVLREATMHTSVNLTGLLALLVWGVVGALAATRTFRFT